MDMGIVKLPKMNESEITRAISQEKICRIAFIDGNFPYICPFQYVFLNNTLYFHFTDYGKKKKILSKNNNVCVSIEHFEENLTQYHFIAIQGKLEKVIDINEQQQAILELFNEGKNSFSTNFLSVHGFNKNKGWEEFSNQKSLNIYKLANIQDKIGLKSF